MKTANRFYAEFRKLSGMVGAIYSEREKIRFMLTVKRKRTIHTRRLTQWVELEECLIRSGDDMTGIIPDLQVVTARLAMVFGHLQEIRIEIENASDGERQSPVLERPRR